MQDRALVTAWYCMGKVDNWFINLGAQGTALMLPMLSIDRLLAMAAPSLYFNLGRGYAKAMCGGAYMYTVASLAAAVTFSYLTERVAQFPAICGANNCVPPWYASFSILRLFGFTLSSVIIYIIALLFLYIKGSKLENDTVKREYKKRQVKVTKLLFIVIVMSFFLYNVPMFLAFLVTFKVKGMDSLAPYVKYMWPITHLNYCNNALIYIVKNRQIGQGVTELFRGKSNKVIALKLSGRSNTNKLAS